MESELNNSEKRPRKVRADKGKARKAPDVPLSPQYRSKAIDEIDSRIAQAIVERGQASEQLAKISYWQEKLTRLNQEIDTLIGYQQRLSGRAVTPSGPPLVDPMSLIPPPAPPRGIIEYSHLQPVPPGVGSIPAKNQTIRPSENVADAISNEGGFS